MSLTIFTDIVKKNKISWRECSAISETVSWPGKLKSERILSFGNKTLMIFVQSVSCYWVGEGSKRTLHLVGPQFLGHQEESEVLPHAANKFIKERAERTPRRRGGQNQERHWCRNDEVWGVFKTGFLYIHLARRGLTILIDISKLHNNRLYCTGLFHNSVCYNQIM